MWRQQVKQRLEAAVEDILCIFEKTVVNYEQELIRFQKNEPQSNFSDAVLLPRDQLHTSLLPANTPQNVLSKKHSFEEQRPDVDQWDPENLHIKEEESWTGVEGEEISGKKTIRLPFAAVCLKSEDDEGVRLFSQLHRQQGEGRYLPSSSSADPMMAATGGEDSGRAGTTTNPALYTQEDDSSSSETEVSEEDEKDVCSPDSQQNHLSDSGSKTEDSDADRKESRSSRCSECRKQFLNNGSHHGPVPSLPRTSSSTCLLKLEEEMNIADSHRKVETKLKSFSCDSCGKKCTRKATLNTRRTVLAKEKPFTCYLCGWRFRSENHFDKHMRVHKPFACEICGNRFGHKSNLKSHLIIHTGEKPYACNVCELRFSRKPHLNRHKMTHTGQKPFSCDVCGKRFTRKEHLRRHMRKPGAKHSFPKLLKT